MTTARFKAHLKSALIRPVFLILLVIALFLAPASAFAGGDDSPEPDNTPATEQDSPVDQSGGFEAPAPAETFNSHVDFEQDFTGDFSVGNAGIDSGTTDPDTSPGGTDGTIGSDTSAPEQELEPPETASGTTNDVDSSGETEAPAADTQTSETGTPVTESPDCEAGTPVVVQQNGEADTTGPGNSYTAKITPDTVVDGIVTYIDGLGNIIPITGAANTAFTIIFTEVGDKVIGSAQVTMPDLYGSDGFKDFSFDPSTGITTSSGKNWTGELVNNGGLYYLNLWAQSASDYLITSESVSATFSATTPNLGKRGAYVFETKAWTDAAAGFNGVGLTVNNMATGYSNPVIIVGRSVADADELNDVRNDLDDYYVQTANINLSTYGVGYDSGKGWLPIGPSYYSWFTGAFDGNCFTINNLYINRPDEDNIGLFGYTAGSAALLKDIKLVAIDVTGKNTVGGLVGFNYVTISNSIVTGTVDGIDNVGGLVGQNNGGTIIDSSTSVAVVGVKYVGGLVGYNGGVVGGTISNSHAEGAVRGTDYVGGLVGHNDDISDSYISNSYISNSYATGTVTGNKIDVDGKWVESKRVGGLVGSNDGTISDSYASGAVTGRSNLDNWDVPDQYSESVGGLVGSNIGQIIDSYASGEVNGFFNTGGLVGSSSGEISNSYASGNVYGWSCGGLVGQNNSGTISYSYATGLVGGDSGGLVGQNNGGTISNSYWDIDTSKELTSAGGGSGKTTTEMQQLHTFSNWSISDQGGESTIWRIYEGSTYPLLRNFFTNTATITITAGNKTYDGGTTLINGDYDIEANKIEGYVHEGTVTYNAASKNAGEHEIILRGVYSNQLEYDLIFETSPTFTITARPITVTAVSDTRIYDGTTDSAGVPKITSANKLADGDTATWTQSFGTKNVGTGKTITPTGIVNDGNSGNNYVITFVNDITGVINKLAITVTAETGTKVYDGNTSSSGVPTITTGALVASDSVTWTQTYDNKNVGTGKVLTPAGTVNDGNSGNNYVVTFANDTTGVISTLAITVTAVTGTKVYDGNTSSSGVPTITTGALVASDSVTWTQTYDNKNVGTGKVLTPAGTVNDGNSGSNYAVTFANDTTGVINTLLINVTATTDTKVYDGTTDSAGVPTITSANKLADGDTATWTQSFNTKNVGTGKTITPAGTVNDGNSGNNYVVTFANDTNGVITARSLTLSNFVADNKEYDGTTAVLSGAGFNDDRIAGDVLTFSYNVAFDDKNVGTGKDVYFTNIVISGGADQNNYNLLNTFGNAKANITPKSLVITATDITKLYYSNYTFTGTEFTTAGLVSGDDVTFAVITSAGAPKTALPGDYVISIGNAAGTGLSNYDITCVDGTMSVVLLSIGSFNGSDNQDLYLINPFTALDDSALTVITGGPNAQITPAYITSGDQFDLAQASVAYNTALDRYEEVKDLLTDQQRALFETELAIAKAAILAMEARLMAADGLPYNLAALQAAYAAAAATLSAQQGFLSADQLAAANQLLAAIAAVISALQYGVT
jgi:hypothetical protein